MGESTIRIITVNIPISYLKAIDNLTGKTGLYPSRSELIRVAVRDFLISELQTAKSFAAYHEKKQKVQELPAIDENLFVRIPVGNDPVDGSPEYKTFRIVQR